MNCLVRPQSCRLPWPVIVKHQWPKVGFKDKRAITLEEHQKIIGAEVNPERKTMYQLCWHLGASQGDIASLKGEDVDVIHSVLVLPKISDFLFHLGRHRS